MSSSQTTSASNNESVAAVLTSRGFKWQSFDIEKVQRDSQNISFDEEWTQFASLVAAMTLHSVGQKTPLTATNAWTNHFQSIIPNPGKPAKRGKPATLHGSEDMFKNRLFKALRDSLNGFVYPNSSEISSNVIILQCSDINVGFGKEVNRDKLGFKEGYGLAKKSKPDHGCFVFGTRKRPLGSNEINEIHDMTAVVELKLESSSCRNFAVYSDEEETDTNEEETTGDEMADSNKPSYKKSNKRERNKEELPKEETTEGKTTEEEPREFNPLIYNDETTYEETNDEKRNEEESPKDESNSVNATERGMKEIKPPVFVKDHAPLGQAMLYSMDVWHCLARRGVSVTSVPVVVLAGESEPKDNPQICCLEAHIQVPFFCGSKFLYSVDRIVSFDGTIGLQVNEALTAEMAALSRNTRDKRAIAMYIRTMRIGLELAMQIIKNQGDADSICPPLSLCCHHLLETGIPAPLIASPIPDANSIQGSVLKVKQGELFQLTKPKKGDFSGFCNMQWFFDFETDVFGVKVEVKLPENCLVKVSCASVHNTSVSHLYCKEAFKILHGLSVELKQEISKVLLGFCHIGKSKMLVTILKDLRATEKKFQTLKHEIIHQDGKLPQLWSAFCVLVETLLLPMANANVIHLDIRSDGEITHNILVYENPVAVNNNPALFELRLIDFDSVVVSGSTPGTRQPYGIYWEDLENTFHGDEWESAHRYLFWQVLWVAYTWYPPALSVPNTRRKKRTARTFVQFLTTKKYCVDFKKWLTTGTVQSLKSMNDEIITAETIKSALSILREAFSRVSRSG